MNLEDKVFGAEPEELSFRIFFMFDEKHFAVDDLLVLSLVLR